GRTRTEVVDVGAYALAPATHFEVLLIPAGQTDPVAGPIDALAGQSFTVVVNALDANGNAGAYYGTLELTSTDGLTDFGGLVIQAGGAAVYQFTAADPSSHSFRVTLNSDGSQTIHVVDSVQRTMHTDSAAISVTAGAPQVQSDSLKFGVMDANGQFQQLS